LPLSLLLISCEWDNDDINYIEVDKGDLKNLSIDLAGINPNELIEISNNSFFYYSLSDDAFKLINQQFYLDGIAISSWTNSTQALISVPEVDDEVHYLKLKMEISDHSLLSYLLASKGYAMYEGTYNFRIKITEEGSSRLNTRQSLADGKYLRVDWDNPKGITMKEYIVYDDYQDTIAHITDLTNTFFIDKNYVYGYKKYTIEGIPDKKQQSNYIEFFQPSYTPITNDNTTIEIQNLNDFLVTWKNKNPYPIQYVVLYNNKPILVPAGNLQVTVNRDNLFPIQNEFFDLYMLPVTADYTNYAKYNSARIGLRDKMLNKTDFTIDYTYYNEQLYIITFNDLIIYDTHRNMQVVHQSPIEITHTGNIIKVADNGYIGILGNNLTVYAPLAKEKLKSFEKVKNFFFGGNLLMVHFENNQHPSFYDLNTLEPRIIEGLEDYTSNTSSFHLALNGDYLICKNYQQEIILLKIEDHKAIWTKTINQLNGDPVFNPTNRTEVLFYDSFNTIEIRNLKDLSLKKSIQGTFCNIDPETGNLLYCSSYENPITFKLLDKTYTTTLLNIKAKHLGNTKAYFFNNIFIYNDYYLDYSTTLKP